MAEHMAVRRSMELDEFQAKAIETAIFPNRKTFLGLVYALFKLHGKAFQISERLSKIVKDHNSHISAEDNELLAKELGGVLQYTALIADELGHSLSHVAKLNLAKLDRKHSKVSGEDR